MASKEKKDIGDITIDQAIESLRKQTAEENGEVYVPSNLLKHAVASNAYTYAKLETIEDIAMEIHNKRSLYLTNEEATKQGLILPLLNYIGYETENVNDVYPEYPVTDGRVDYVLKIEGELRHVFEAKRLDRKLYRQISQLEGYFNQIDTATIGILSDGNHYLFFGDLNEKQKMDTTPFLHICLSNNFRNERVKTLLDCYRLTRFDIDYVESKLKTNDSAYLASYSKMQQDLNALELTAREREGLQYYLPTLLIQKNI